MASSTCSSERHGPRRREGVRWIRTDRLNLPPLVSPCGTILPSDAERVGGRQLALVGPTLWKLERLVVYCDAESAQRAMGERRTALEECARHNDGDGTATVWTWQSLQIGDEAMFVGSQRYRGAKAIPGSYRGVL